VATMIRGGRPDGGAPNSEHPLRDPTTSSPPLRVFGISQHLMLLEAPEMASAAPRAVRVERDRERGRNRFDKRYVTVPFPGPT